MKAEINDLSQFFRFSQIQKSLIFIAENNHQILYKEISNLFRDSKRIISTALKKDSYLKRFCKMNQLSIIDLDLLQIALSEQTKEISPEQYLEKSILVAFNKSNSPEIINKVSHSKLIRDNFLKFINPFDDDNTIDKEIKSKTLRFLKLNDKAKPKEIKRKIECLTTKQARKLNKEVLQNKYHLLVNDNFKKFKLKLFKKIINSSNKTDKGILTLLNCPLSKKKSKKPFRLEFEVKEYKRFEDLLKDIHLLDKILNSPINNKEGISKKNLDLIYTAQLRKVKSKYKKTLQKKEYKFSQFISKNKIEFKEFLSLVKILTNEYYLNYNQYRISDELYVQFKDTNSINKLLKLKLIQKNWDFELTKESIKGLLDIDIDDNELKIINVETPKQTFKQISLPNNIKKRILDVINQQKNKGLIFNQWGLGESIGYGKGITLNFSGPPGTGKTLSARAIANYLNKKLLTINYAGLESAYVGETQKNIAQAFKIAKKEDAVLFFDEADSLTTSRSNTSRSWEISRTNTLLKELEDFEGVCIFATNFTENYDEAFNRRLSVHIEFTLPEKKQLKDILKIHFPKKEALSPDIEFSIIAKKFEGIFSGGDIKNVVLNTARIASGDELNKEKLIKQEHLMKACKIVIDGKRNNTLPLDEPSLYFG